MGKKTLTNAHCLMELAELATVPTLKAFSGLQECQALARGFDWSRDEDQLSVALVDHIKHLRKTSVNLQNAKHSVSCVWRHRVGRKSSPLLPNSSMTTN
jgi:hypothetical protein